MNIGKIPDLAIDSVNPMVYSVGMTQTTNNAAEILNRGDYVHDALDNRTYRFARYERSIGGFTDVVLMEMESERELPDTRTRSQVRRMK